MKNLQMRKRILSVVLAMGFSLCPEMSLADIISYNSSGARLKNGTEAKLFLRQETKMTIMPMFPLIIK